MPFIELQKDDYLNTDLIQRAVIRTYRVLDPGSGTKQRKNYGVPEHLWLKMASGEVLEFTGERMERVLKEIRGRGLPDGEDI